MHSFTFSIFFLFSIPAITLSDSISFSLAGFGTHESNNLINTEGDAYITPQGIQLTPNEISVEATERAGRATYIEPLHLWDKSSGNLSDFSTHFTFVIDSSGRSNFADGITFFLAPVNSSIRPNATGGSIGLNAYTQSVGTDSSAEAFFAVEFDTYENTFDPICPHVGININSMQSVATAYWKAGITQGSQNEAWISYSGSSKFLTVNFTNVYNDTIEMGSLTRVIDLREYMPEKVVFGFSGATGTYFERNTIKSWDFSSNLNLDITSTVPAPSPIPGPTINFGEGKRKRKRGVAVLAFGLGAGLLILILVLGFAGCFLMRKKRHNKGSTDAHKYAVDPSMDVEFGKHGAKKFSYVDLARATNAFARELKLGEGGFGEVYKGFFKETNSYVAVKRVSTESKQGLKEYASEVTIISQLRHKNLVQLMGWCHERGELLLVYEFLPNGSLDSHLFEHKSVLTWEARYRIAQGLTSALLYLHEEWKQCVIHRDIKSSNVMLDSNLNAKLGDFGLARLVDHEKGSQTTNVVGTSGYMAPEYVISGRASKESDIYSLGVVLLELACGRRVMSGRFQENEQFGLVKWVWNLYGAGKVLDSAEQDLLTEQNVEELKRVLVLGLWCAHPDNQQRPTIQQAKNVLDHEAQLPPLPEVMPVLIYHSPSMNMVASSAVDYNTGGGDCMVNSHHSSSSNYTAASAGSNNPLAPLLESA